MTDFYDQSVDDALTREELDNLKPSTEEMFQNTKRATVWYNEAVWTAASLMVEACERSDKFRDAFMSERKEEVETFPDEDDSSTVEMQAWRSLIEDECPDVADRLWGIGLSAFQGGSAEQVARRYIERNA